jgi:cell division protein FtsN
LLVAIACAVSLGACSSVSDKLTEKVSELPGIGLPANAPQRPTSPVAFPAVHDVPPARPAALLNDAERQKVEKDLVEARTRQQAEAGTEAPGAERPKAAPKTTPKPAPSKKTTPARAASPVPSSSSRTIY